MKSPTPPSLDALLLTAQRTKSVRMQQLSNELYTLASVLAPPPRAKSSRSVAIAQRARITAKRMRIHCALLIENGLMEADGRPVGWTREQDIADENQELSELSVSRRLR